MAAKSAFVASWEGGTVDLSGSRINLSNASGVCWGRRKVEQGVASSRNSPGKQ